jgi:hypothetical protein
MGAREFAVERLGIGDWPDVSEDGETVISLETWDGLVDDDSAIASRVALALDVSPDRRYASISGAGLRGDGLQHGELIERGRGTGWVVARALELVDEHDPVAFLYDSASPAGSLVPELEKAGVEMTAVTADEHTQACGMLFDLVDQKGLRHLGQDELASALKGAKKRTLGDRWAWSRKNSSIDITPLVSFTLAVFGARTIEPEQEGDVMVAFA